MSAFVWLDYSERERRKMLEVVDLFREHDTRDELGVGSVRDAFADMLFPGTSTIMTRARYFLLVPWAYQRLERLHVRSAEIAARARQAELNLVEPIELSDDNDGNIGKVAKNTLKRLPSSVYWQGLSVWGIRSFRGAQVQYHRSLDRYYAQLTRHGGRASERDVEHDDLVSSNWHAGLVSPPEDFPRECSLSLTRGEAEYLAERIRLSPACAGSLLAELVAQRRRNDDVSFAWEHPHCAALPPKLREMLDHAQNFSEVMHGAPLLYNLILAEQAHRNDSVAKYRRNFGEWAKLLSARSRDLAQWKRERFWELVRSVNPRITARTYEFINSWWDLALAGNAAGLSDSQAARLLISERERCLKKNLARIDNPRAQELWTGDSGTAQLEFRWSISQQLLGDIFDGLEAPDA
ncbi:MAG: DUF6361 family protein [Candidatus Sulfotelmatobacter sp.]